MRIASRILLLAALATILLASPLIAGNTGKIVGKITDKNTGEPLFGVNVSVVGTTRGATTDPDGKFNIIGIPIGSYAVRASAIGYANSEVKDVKIGADETTQLNFQMSTSEVEVAFQWNTGYNRDGIHSFANGISTNEGGTHEEGFKTALTRVVNNYAKDNRPGNVKDLVLTGDAPGRVRLAHVLPPAAGVPAGGSSPHPLSPAGAPQDPARPVIRRSRDGAAGRG